MQEIVATINSYVWSSALVYLCLGAGLFFSIMTRFVQVQAVQGNAALAIPGQGIGTGHFHLPGAGRIAVRARGHRQYRRGRRCDRLWRPGCGFLDVGGGVSGRFTAYVESALGQIYKEVDEGQYRGGPAFYIEKALGQKWYAWIFAMTTVLAMGFLLPGVQANAIGNAVDLAVGGGVLIDSPFGEVGRAKLIVGGAIVVIPRASSFLAVSNASPTLPSSSCRSWRWPISSAHW